MKFSLGIFTGCEIESRESQASSSQLLKSAIQTATDICKTAKKARDWLPRDQLCLKGPGDPGRLQAKHDLQCALAERKANRSLGIANRSI